MATGDPAARRLLRSVLVGQRSLVTACIAAGLAWQGVAIAVPWVLERALDDGLIGSDRGALARWCGLLVALGLLGWVADAARHWYVEQAGAAGAADLRLRLTRRVLSMSDDEVAAHGEGEIASRMVTDTWTVWSWVGGIATFVTSSFTLAAVSVLLLRLDPALAAIGLSAIPLAGLLAFGSARRHHAVAVAGASAAGRYGAAVESVITGARTLKGLGAERNALAGVDVASQRLTSATMRTARLEAWWLTFATTIPTAAIAVGLWVGGQRVLDGTTTVGTLLAFVAWMSMLVNSTTTLTSRLATRGEALAAARRLAQLLAEPSDGRDHTDRPESADAPLVTGPTTAGSTIAGRAIRCASVTVCRGGRTILDRVDLDLDAGSWTALTGATGEGKTSLLRVLAGLDAPAGGHLCICTQAHDGRRPAFVPQGAFIVSGRVGDVLRLGAPAATNDEIWAALDVVDAREVVEGLGGLEGRIDDRGASLSGGQRQRLALAAAVLGRPTVLLLDDTTSALDERTERRVLTRLRAALPATTVVIATHRPAATAACGAVAELAAGRLTWRHPQPTAEPEGAMP